MTAPLALSDHQLSLLQSAASRVPLHDRDRFLRSVAGRLTDVTDVDDSALATAIDFVLATRGMISGERSRRQGGHERRNLNNETNPNRFSTKEEISR